MPTNQLMCDTLLLTVTDTETQAVLTAALALTGEEDKVVHGHNNTYHDLGLIAEARTWLVRCEMGSGQPGASCVTVTKAVAEVDPKAVIMVGVCYGFDPEQQPIGTVLVSRQVHFNGLQRLDTDKTGNLSQIFRGDKATSSSLLLQRFRASEVKFKQANVQFGLLLSDQKLIDNANYRDALRKQNPDAIGGEMEAEGLYAACEGRHWLVVKAVCDYADGKRREHLDEQRNKAAANAASFVFHTLAEGGFSRAEPDQPGEPQPVFPNEHIRQISQDLGKARARLEQQSIAGESLVETKQHILELRRQLREGGQRQPGEVLSGRYKLIDILGRGGFAIVWKAYDLKKHEVVAIKMLHGQYANDRTRRERFFRGACKMGVLQHPGIVRVLSEQEQDEGFYYFVMAHWDGGNFREKVIGGQLDQETCLEVIQTVGTALAHAHQHGLVHRDIKPQNILLDRENRACLTDFDLVKAADSTGGTRTQAGMGTFVYAAPELMAEARDADVTADVYGLGMTALFALHGTDLPFEVLRDAPAIITRLTCPPHLKKAIEKAVAWRCEDRYPSVEAFCTALLPPDPIQFKPETKNDFQPDQSWVYIEPGEFTMGDDEGRYDKPAHPVRITQDFWMGRYTVTNREYRKFMDDRGYQKRRFWSNEGWAWLQLKDEKFDQWYADAKEKYQDLYFANAKWYKPGAQPTFWDDADFNADDQPVVGISWFEASAYCKWLSESMSQTSGADLLVFLPSEAQWEWAARGSVNRKYPWGAEFPTEEFANFDGDLGKTSPVGSHAKGATPTGLDDMAGNVWEWCRDNWSSDIYKQRKDGVPDPVNDQGDAAEQVLRGGAWLNVADFLRASVRSWNLVWRRNFDIGFRCCLFVQRSPEPVEH